MNSSHIYVFFAGLIIGIACMFYIVKNYFKNPDLELLILNYLRKSHGSNWDYFNQSQQKKIISDFARRFK